MKKIAVQISAPTVITRVIPNPTADLKDTNKLLIGVIYRSPNCTKENHNYVRTLLRNACQFITSHLLIVGDFNYSNIN